MAKYQDELKLIDGVSGPLKNINKNLGITQKHFKKLENIKQLGNDLKDFGKKMTIGVTLPVIAAGGAMVKLASDMEETLNKVDVSFGKSSEVVKQWAKSSVTTMGLAQQTALDSAALFGDMATGMGLSQQKASEMAMTLTQLGADLASFKNISNEMATTALKSIFTGETESLKNLGVVMTQTNLEQFAMSKGIRKQIKNMTEAEKIQLRYNYVMEKTKNAHGDFVRTGGGAANQTRMFQEQLKELGVLFGQEILPLFTKVIIKINGILKAFSSMSPVARRTILILAGISAVIGPLIGIIGGLVGAIRAVNLALAFLAANPVVLTIMAIVAGIAALVAIVMLAIKGIKKLVGWFKKLKNAKESANIDMATPKIASGVGNQINNSYSQRASNTTNNNTNTTNNFYGNIVNPTSSYLGDIIGTGGMLPVGG